MICNLDHGWGPWSSDRILDFTLCFEYYLLDSIPKLFILVVGTYIIYMARNKPRYIVPTDAGYYSKLGFSIALALGSLVLAFADKKPVQVHYGVNAVVFSFTAYLHSFEHFHSKVSSSPLMLFWLFSFVIDLIMLRTALAVSGSLELYYFSIRGSIMLFQFLLECCVPKQPSFYTTLDDDENVTPEEVANIFSRLTFHWMTPLMKLGYSKPLDMEDLWNLKPADSAEKNSFDFQQRLSQELNSKNPSLARAMFLTFWKTLFISALYKFSQDVLQFTQPQLLNMIVAFGATYSPDSDVEPMPLYKGLVIASMMFFTAVTQTLFLHQYFHQCFMMGMHIRSCLITGFYD